MIPRIDEPAGDLATLVPILSLLEHGAKRTRLLRVVRLDLVVRVEFRARFVRTAALVSTCSGRLWTTLLLWI